MRVRRLILIVLCAVPLPGAAQTVSLTVDDGPMIEATPLMSAEERNEAILGHLRQRQVQALFFVTLKNGADRPQGLALLRRLSDGGQLIANHTATHPDFNAETTGLETFEQEILRCDAVIRELPGYRKLFRFPFLREGATVAKRDGIRAFLREHEYGIGYVSIDTSDWLLDQALTRALAEQPSLDLKPWRDLYLAHLWNHALAYERLARRMYGREVNHTLLLHHRLINALFLGDVIDMFRSRGWKIVSPDVAFADPAYQVAPMLERLDGSVLETTAQALGVPRQPSLDGLQTERQLAAAADGLLSNAAPPRAHARARESARFYKSFDGTRIHYEISGKGPAVVLLHGFTGTADSWKRTALYERLRDGGFTVIVPEMRGNGRSDKPHRPEAYEHDAEARDIIGLVTHLKLRRYSLVGYSRGSIIASRLLVLDRRVAKAVLGGMGADFMNPEWPRRILFYKALMGEPQPDLEGFMKYIKESGVDQLAMAYLQKAQPSTSQAELAAVAKPVLVVCGDADEDNGSSKDLASFIPGAEYRRVPGDHGSTSKSKAFADEVLVFIAGSR